MKTFKEIFEPVLARQKDKFKGKVVIDCPAGNGVTSELLKAWGAKVLAYDLFPDFFKVPGLECKYADATKGLPVSDGGADYLICQEGIEHFSDQLACLKEFNRTLKVGGGLMITTPNYSNLRGRLSYLLGSSERHSRILPPNEIDSLWLNQPDQITEVYYGHIFLIGIHKLRLLAKLAGFEIVQIHFAYMKLSNLILFPLIYPFIFISSLLNYYRNVRKRPEGKAVYWEVTRLNMSPQILLDGSLIVEFRKVMNSAEVPRSLVQQGHLSLTT